MDGAFCKDVKPDWEAFLSCVRREGTPSRVHYIELFLDKEVRAEICERFGLLDGLDADDPFFAEKKEINVQRFLGYDFVKAAPVGYECPCCETTTEDTAGLKRQGGRAFVDEHKGPITTWDEFHAYPWPDMTKLTTDSLEWHEKNLPDDMCMIGGLVGHYAENLSWLMGYETLCYALYDRRDLVRAISDRLIEMYKAVVAALLQFDRVKVIWGSDDLGFRTGTLISPDDLREFVFPGHKILADMAHKAGRLYFLHSCGKLEQVIDDLIDDVKIDAKHSFEDTIESVLDVKKGYGQRIATLGGVDVDFLCRSTEAQVRERVREILATCQPGGGYCLGSGNTVANYVPVANYLAMLDEGRKWDRA